MNELVWLNAPLIAGFEGAEYRMFCANAMLEPIGSNEPTQLRSINYPRVVQRPGGVYGSGNCRVTIVPPEEVDSIWHVPPCFCMRCWRLARPLP